MRQQNRPYSAIQVFDNLHKRAPKSVVEKVLTSLSEGSASASASASAGGGLVCKEYGKAKIYFVDQATLPSNVSEEDCAKVDREYDVLQRRRVQLESDAKQLRADIAALEDEPADDDLDRYCTGTLLHYITNSTV